MPPVEPRSSVSGATVKLAHELSVLLIDLDAIGLPVGRIDETVFETAT
jgi:hypothetical protein